MKDIVEEFKEELKSLLHKYNAMIVVEQEEDDSMLDLKILLAGKEETIDSGYRDLQITHYNL